MMRSSAIALTGVLLAAGGQASTSTVNTTANGGTGSLRWAINQANNNPGTDKIVFAASLDGDTIQPTSALPALTDDETTINGDINNDGAPNVCLDGANAGYVAGLVIQNAGQCTIVGLAVTHFGQEGVLLSGADHCVIRTCHIGVDLAGTQAARNGTNQLRLNQSDSNTIGGEGVAGRNVISGGAALQGHSAVVVYESSGNLVRNNNLGIARDGTTALTAAAESANGIFLYASPAPGEAANTIGGTTPGDRNVIGGASRGILLRQSSGNSITGNYIGLGRNGSTVVAIEQYGIRIVGGSAGNIIGGSAAGARNVIASGIHGVMFEDAGTEDNEVLGNYFGVNAAGTAQRPIANGVRIISAAGPQVIGRAGAGNYFCAKSATFSLSGVAVEGAAGTVIEGNSFGILPDNSDALPLAKAVSVYHTAAQVLSNRFRGAEEAVSCNQSTSGTQVMRNAFSKCIRAVELRSDAVALLGDRSNVSTADDGLNVFYNTNSWYVYNETDNNIKAEGNRFQTTNTTTIHQKIIDHSDYAQYGVVDIVPVGPIIHLFPLGAPTTLALGPASAVATDAGGAEITFSLSAPAEVTVEVLNIAGRVVAGVTGRDARPTRREAGLQRMVWSGRSDNGTRVPNGRYLVRITAREGSGEQVTGLCALSLGGR